MPHPYWTNVRAHPRQGTRGVRAHPRRYLTVAQVAAGRGSGVGRGALDSSLIAQGLSEGYAARGPWEVERRGNTVTLLHYAFPIATAKFNESSGWEITSMRGRPGYGMSMTDRAGVRTLSASLNGDYHIELPPTGLNPDPRLRARKYGGTYRGGGMGGRVSPYASVDEDRLATYGATFGPAWIPYGRPEGENVFPARRGRRTRK